MLGTSPVERRGLPALLQERAPGRGAELAGRLTHRAGPQLALPHVIGSSLHKIVYPDFHYKHRMRNRQLEGGYLNHVHHHSKRANTVQLRGEYVYIADGPGGLRIFDVAQIDQKGFSERIVSAPISPLDQRFFVRTRDAASMASPPTTASPSGSARSSAGSR